MGRIIALGGLTGVRSMAGPAVLTQALARTRTPGQRRLEWRASTPGLPLVMLAALALEMLADKHPRVPARVQATPLFGRAAIGALVGATWAESEGADLVKGAMVGAASAVCAASIAHRARTRSQQRLEGRGAALGLAEDIAVLAAGVGLWGLLRRATTSRC